MKLNATGNDQLFSVLSTMTSDQARLMTIATVSLTRGSKAPRNKVGSGTCMAASSTVVRSHLPILSYYVLSVYIRYQS